MDYKDFRKKFCEQSGRYDLMNATYEDSGADFFINAGQRYLDRLQDTGKMKAKHIQAVAAGTIKVYTPGLRSLLEVYAGTTVDGLIRLAKADLSYLRQEYGEQLSGVTQGTPSWYAPATFRPYVDASTTTTLSGYYDIDDLILPVLTTPTHYANTGIVIMPPPDKTYYVSIYGLFYSPTLSATLAAGVWTQTTSFWLQVHEDILMQAAMYKLEVFYRNSEGAKDWKSALIGDVEGMDKDEALEESSDIMEMGG
jgi:hypothetical protein